MLYVATVCGLRDLSERQETLETARRQLHLQDAFAQVKEASLVSTVPSLVQEAADSPTTEAADALEAQANKAMEPLSAAAVNAAKAVVDAFCEGTTAEIGTGEVGKKLKEAESKLRSLCSLF